MKPARPLLARLLLHVQPLSPSDASKFVSHDSADVAPFAEACLVRAGRPRRQQSLVPPPRPSPPPWTPGSRSPTAARGFASRTETDDARPPAGGGSSVDRRSGSPPAASPMRGAGAPRPSSRPPLARRTRAPPPRGRAPLPPSSKPERGRRGTWVILFVHAVDPPPPPPRLSWAPGAEATGSAGRRLSESNADAVYDEARVWFEYQKARNRDFSLVKTGLLIVTLPYYSCPFLWT